jgi:S-adenosylmethionine decarboxylase
MVFAPTQYGSQEKISLSGFNNLTKIVSFNLYDFCITLDEQQRQEYVRYINDKYSASHIVKVSEKICECIKANVLSISQQDYEPVGASSMVLMSDIMGGGWENKKGPESSQVSCHLDKSHITAHTYPDAGDPAGICSFRVDIDIATCGDIIPLDAMNTLFEAFECDVVVIDYVVRGYTRLANGKKIYNDYHFNSIQDFIRPDILSQYQFRSDINMPHDNIWQTKLRIREDFSPERYLLNGSDKDHPLVQEKMGLLMKEMREVFHLLH